MRTAEKKEAFHEKGHCARFNPRARDLLRSSPFRRVHPAGELCAPLRTDQRNPEPGDRGETYHFPVKQGDFFFYFNRMQGGRRLPDAHFDWLRMFRVLKTNGYYTMPRYSAKRDQEERRMDQSLYLLNGFYDCEAYSAQFGTPPEGVIYGVPG